MTGLTRDVSSRWRPLPPSTDRVVIMSAPCAEHIYSNEFRYALVALNPMPQAEVGASGGGGVRAGATGATLAPWDTHQMLVAQVPPSAPI